MVTQGGYQKAAVAVLLGLFITYSNNAILGDDHTIPDGLSEHPENHIE